MRRGSLRGLRGFSLPPPGSPLDREEFCDGPALTDAGIPIVRAIARRLSHFDWAHVEHDVLKVLYESVIDADTRQKLGEYYTPDWLAERMVEKTFDDPANQRLLDPACG